MVPTAKSFLDSGGGTIGRTHPIVIVILIAGGANAAGFTGAVGTKTLIAFGAADCAATLDTVFFTSTVIVLVLITGVTLNTAGVGSTITFIAGTKSFVVCV